MSSRNSEEENILPVEPSDEANNNEKEACDEVTKKLEHFRFSKIVRLNVGGHFFSTNLATLNKDPGMFWYVIFKLHCHLSDFSNTGTSVLPNCNSWLSCFPI